MFFDSPRDLPQLAQSTNFAIFAISPAVAKLELAKSFRSEALFLEPDAKTTKISTEMVRDFAAMTSVKAPRDRFFVILNAEALNPPAQNALLKNLEEPQPRHHFILVTQTPSSLLPTVLSRAQIFYLKEANTLQNPVVADEKVKTLARKLITADAEGLIALANDLSKKKDNPRVYSLEVVGTAIEILYKSYFATGQDKLLKKLPRLLTLYDNLARNGHVKLHIVADML